MVKGWVMVNYKKDMRCAYNKFYYLVTKLDAGNGKRYSIEDLR